MAKKLKRITLVSEDKQFSIVLPQKGKVTIGRKPPTGPKLCDVATPSIHGKVSRKHCSITQGKKGVFIQDDKSKNGTFVNGKKLTRKKHGPLANNTRIKLGNYALTVQIK